MSPAYGYAEALAAGPSWRPPERRLLVLVVVSYAVIGVRLMVAPSTVTGGPGWAALFLASAVVVAVHAVRPADRRLRALAGALATVAAASRALVIAAQALAGDIPPADAVLGATMWVLVAGLLLFAWARVQPPPPA